MYDIGISEITINKRLEDLDGRSIVYQASASSRPCKCENPACGKELKPHKHSKYRCFIQDIKAEGKLVYIDLTVQRYKLSTLRQLLQPLKPMLKPISSSLPTTTLPKCLA